MIIRNESLENGKHNVIVDDVEEIESDTSPAVRVTYKTIEDELFITQRYSANLKPGSPLIQLIYAIYGEVPREIDTDYLIGNECTIEVDYVESNSRYYQNVFNVYPIDSSEDYYNDSYEEQEDSTEDDLGDFEEEIAPHTKVTRKKRSFK